MTEDQRNGLTTNSLSRHHSEFIKDHFILTNTTEQSNVASKYCNLQKTCFLENSFPTMLIMLIFLTGVWQAIACFHIKCFNLHTEPSHEIMDPHGSALFLMVPHDSFQSSYNSVALSNEHWIAWCWCKMQFFF